MTTTAKAMPKPEIWQGAGYLIKKRIHEAAASAFSEEERSRFAEDCSRCHCGKCRRFARCKFREPRCINDVLHNVRQTGSKAGTRICTVGTTLEHYVDDVVVSFGAGAGSCLSGWEISRGAPITHCFGVEVEPLATRLSRAAFPSATIERSTDAILLPSEGRVIAITSLVFNLVSADTARRWAEFLTSSRSQFFHVNVGRVDEPGTFAVFEATLRKQGMRAHVHQIPINIDQHDVGYATQATWWCR